MGFPPQPWVVLALVVCQLIAVAVSLGAAAFAWRAAWPIGVRRLAHDLAERIDALELEWRKTKGQLAVDVEELEQLEESIERKRARTATAAARLAPQQQQSVIPTDRTELKRLARARGFQV